MTFDKCKIVLINILLLINGNNKCLLIHFKYLTYDEKYKLKMKNLNDEIERNGKIEQSLKFI